MGNTCTKDKMIVQGFLYFFANEKHKNQEGTVRGI